MNNLSILELISHIHADRNISKHEIWWLLEHVCKKTKTQLLFNVSEKLSDEEFILLEKCLHDLTIENKPLAYIIGHVPFHELTLQVQPPILIPRPETEELVVDIISELKNHAPISILDIGTGSGCIGISMAHAFPKSTITMIDISQQALFLAQKNSIKNNCENVEFLQSDVYQNLENKKFDIIISNPPYIDPIMHKNLAPQVKNWEDINALCAQDSGLAIIKTILQNAHKHLSTNTDFPFRIALEVDHTQPELVCNIALACGFTKAWWKKDIFGNPRFVYCW